MAFFTRIHTASASLALILAASACGGAVEGDTPRTQVAALGAPGDAGSKAHACDHDGKRARGRHGDGGGHHGKGSGRGHFQRLDRDGDGKVLVAELPPRLREHLASADANGDGVLAAEELHAAREARRAEWLRRADTDGDGTVSDEEWSAAASKWRHRKHDRKAPAGGPAHAL
jgi:hypothetical protein